MIRLGPRKLISLLGSAALLPAATLASSYSPLSYDPAVFLAGNCLSPDLSACGGAAARARPGLSASAAVIEANREPRLALDLAGVFELGPELTGGAVAASLFPPDRQRGE